MSEHHVTVDELYAGIRLDKFLSVMLPQFTRSRMQQLIEQGMVRVVPPTKTQERFGSPSGGELASGTVGAPQGIAVTNSATKIKIGETYVVTEPEAVPTHLVAEKIALDVVYEDADLLVINKPSGMTVHPAPGANSGTLVHALLAHCGDSLSGIGGVARPGIVHRIDKDTTGLLVVAKNDAAHQHLSAQLKERTLKRRYVAFCWSALNPRVGEIEAPLARHPRLRKQMAVVENGRYALTHYEVQQMYQAPGFIVPLASRVVCELETGRTHQIRVHMAHAKAALIGDAVYGQPTGTRLNRLKSQGVKLAPGLIEVLQSFNRQALHAAELSLIHPKSNEELHFYAPMPEDMVTLEKALATLTK